MKQTCHNDPLSPPNSPNNNDNDNNNPMWSNDDNNYHIEQLRLIEKLMEEENNTFYLKLHEMTININKQNCMIDNIISSLSDYDEMTRNFFQDTMIDIMINLINDKSLFSDLMLNLCWKFEENMLLDSDNNLNILDSKLWKTIYSTCNKIIKNKNEKDWHWLKTVLIPSTVWFQFLYFMYN